MFGTIECKLILLGRKVGSAFQCYDLEFGEQVSFFHERVTGLLLPHPSPRNRFFNVTKNREDIKVWVDAFLR